MDYIVTLIVRYVLEELGCVNELCLLKWAWRECYPPNLEWEEERIFASEQPGYTLTPKK
jgi:hypothetical protein